MKETTVYKLCPNCGGTGQMANLMKSMVTGTSTLPCNVCNGSKYIVSEVIKEEITPKLPLSALAEDKETCEKIAELLGWEEEDFTVKYLEKHVKPKVCFWNESRSMQFNINTDGEIALFDPAYTEFDILKFEPIRHCRQICSLLHKYEI